MTDEQILCAKLMQAIDLAHFGEQGPQEFYEEIFADSNLTYTIDQGSDWVLVWASEPGLVRCFYAGRLPEADNTHLEHALDCMFDYMDTNQSRMLALCNELYSVPLTQRFCAKRGYDLTLTKLSDTPHPKYGHTFEAVCRKA